MAERGTVQVTAQTHGWCQRPRMSHQNEGGWQLNPKLPHIEESRVQNSLPHPERGREL